MGLEELEADESVGPLWDGHVGEIDHPWLRYPDCDLPQFHRGGLSPLELDCPGPRASGRSCPNLLQTSLLDRVRIDHRVRCSGVDAEPEGPRAVHRGLYEEQLAICRACDGCDGRIRCPRLRRQRCERYEQEHQPSNRVHWWPPENELFELFRRQAKEKSLPV